MSAQTHRSPSDSATHRRPAVWPWLVMPLAALAIYFALLKVRHLPPHTPPAAPAEAPGAVSPGPDGR